MATSTSESQSLLQEQISSPTRRVISINGRVDWANALLSCTSETCSQVRVTLLQEQVTPTLGQVPHYLVQVALVSERCALPRIRLNHSQG